ncbi:MAG TPA: glycosyltransferase [Candidatus Eisenbacteria bacterium]|nr:glycosyltransferase [Candidatus Eisenbacteria bacterium]
MKILQITKRDLSGRRFNGYVLNQALRALGHETSMLVMEKRSRDASVHGYPDALRWVDLGLHAAERMTSLQGLLSPVGLSIPLRECFRSADVVHWQLVQPQFIALPIMPVLARMRPTVWTIHDPWPTTGHCIHPLDCERWKTGCGHCPDLKRNYEVWFDTTAMSWRIKRDLYRRMPVTLVTGSQWLRRWVETSPLLSGFPCHTIPTGLDLEVWKRRDRAACRQRLGIPEDANVLAFRLPGSARWMSSKGGPWLLEALERYQPTRPTVLIAFESAAPLQRFGAKYRVVDMGWLDDDDRLMDALTASDAFLMPSEAENIPTMALEAMACGTPVIGTDNTGFPEMVRPPEAGLLVPLRDAAALAAAIERLLADEPLRRGMGEGGRRRIETDYPLGLYARRHAELYESLLAAHAAGGARS